MQCVYTMAQHVTQWKFLNDKKSIEIFVLQIVVIDTNFIQNKCQEDGCVKCLYNDG